MYTLICNELNRTGYGVTIISLHESIEAPFFPLDKKVEKCQLFNKSLKKYHFALELFAFSKKVRQVNASLAISCDTQICLYSAFPLFGMWHIAWGHFNSETFTLFGSRWFGRRMASWFCNKIIVLTESDRKSWIKQFNTKPNKMVVIPNALPVERLASWQYTTRQKIVLAVGRMTSVKGIDLLIKAWAQIDAQTRKDWKLRIVGPNGSAKPLLGNLWLQYELQQSVELVSESNQVELEYQRASVYVLSSRHEGFGLTLIEAMGQDLAVIAFNCPMGPFEIIAETYGKLLPPYNANQLAESIKQFLLDPILRKNYGQLSYQRSVIYSPANIVNQWETMIHQL